MTNIPNNKKFYIIGICGSAMGWVARLLKDAGNSVAGSDTKFEPPMSELLKKWNIRLYKGYAESNIKQFNPDFVIIGNVVRKDNSEAKYAINSQLDYYSFPSFFEKFLLSHTKNIVVTGTHGKTTTTSLVAWVLEKAGFNPNFFIGGIPNNFSKGFRVSKSNYFAIEGDEYDTAFYDKVPKFMHYRPSLGVITNIEHDHIDIYPHFEDVKKVFINFVNLIPSNGAIIACGDDDLIRKTVGRAKSTPETIFYGFNANNHAVITDMKFDEQSSSCSIKYNGKIFSGIKTILSGEHNLKNIAATFIISRLIGIDFKTFKQAIAEFTGIFRRFDIAGHYNNALLIEDFGHHPSEITSTLKGIRKRYPDKKVVTLFRAESNSSRTPFFENMYIEALSLSDKVILGQTLDKKDYIKSERYFDPHKVALQLQNKGCDAKAFSSKAEILDYLKTFLNSNYVAIVFSPRAYDGLFKELCEAYIVND